MAPKLYAMEMSPPVRSVLLTAEAIGLKLNIQMLDLGKKEQLSKEFLEINPQHTVPTLVDDDGFVVWDSHAIMTYIVEKYAPDDKFFPKDLKKRATINQRLHFDTMSSIKRGEAIKPLFYEGVNSIAENIKTTMKGYYEFLENFLEKSKWIAGNEVTVADFSLIPSVTTMDIIVPVDVGVYPKLWSWMQNAQSWEYYDENKRGHEELKVRILDRLQK